MKTMDRWRKYRYQIQDTTLDELTISEQDGLYQMLRAYAEDGNFHDETDILRLEYSGAVSFLFKAKKIREEQRWNLWELTNQIDEELLKEEEQDEEQLGFAGADRP